jgi:hypothetical protein
MDWKKRVDPKKAQKMDGKIFAAYLCIISSRYKKVGTLFRCVVVVVVVTGSKADAQQINSLNLVHLFVLFVAFDGSFCELGFVDPACCCSSDDDDDDEDGVVGEV